MARSARAMAPEGDSLVLRPNRRGALIAVAVLAVLTVGFAVAAVTVHWLIWVLFLAAACGLAMVGFAALPGRSYLRLDPAGFEIKTPFRFRRFAWADVTPFVAVPLSYSAVVAFRARSSPGADLPPTPEPTAADIAEGAEALPETYGHDAADLAETMNAWRTRMVG